MVALYVTSKMNILKIILIIQLLTLILSIILTLVGLKIDNDLLLEINEIVIVVSIISLFISLSYLVYCPRYCEC